MKDMPRESQLLEFIDIKSIFKTSLCIYIQSKNKNKNFKEFCNCFKNSKYLYINGPRNTKPLNTKL